QHRPFHLPLRYLREADGRVVRGHQARLESSPEISNRLETLLKSRPRATPGVHWEFLHPTFSSARRFHQRLPRAAHIVLQTFHASYERANLRHSSETPVFSYRAHTYWRAKSAAAQRCSSDVLPTDLFGE